MLLMSDCVTVVLYGCGLHTVCCYMRDCRPLQPHSRRHFHLVHLQVTAAGIASVAVCLLLGCRGLALLFCAIELAVCCSS
jgi:hypothetical protein